MYATVSVYKTSAYPAVSLSGHINPDNRGSTVLHISYARNINFDKFKHHRIFTINK